MTETRNGGCRGEGHKTMSIIGVPSSAKRQRAVEVGRDICGISAPTVPSLSSGYLLLQYLHPRPALPRTHPRLPPLNTDTRRVLSLFSLSAPPSIPRLSHCDCAIKKWTLIQSRNLLRGTVISGEKLKKSESRKANT